jgi:hypothetical protein
MSYQTKSFFYTSLFVTILTMVMVFSYYQEPVTVVDSEGYIEYADAIIDGSLFTLRGPENISQDLSLRTPGYPLLLAISRVFSSKLEFALYAHRLVSYAVIVVVFYLLRSFIFPPVIGIALLSSFTYTIVFYPMIMTEWLTLNLLILFFALLFSFFHNSLVHTLFFVALSASIICLIRPALIVVPLITILLILLTSKKRSVFSILYVASPFMLIFIWMTFNWYRLQVFSITPFLGYNMFGVTTMLGEAEVREADSEETKKFIDHVNKRKEFPPAGMKLPIKEFYTDLQPIDHFFHANLIHAAPNEGIDSVTKNRLFLIYSYRVIVQEPVRYLIYIYKGFMRIFNDMFIVLGSVLVICFMFLKFPNKKYFYKTMVCAFIIHVLHIFLCAAVEIVFSKIPAIDLFCAYFPSSDILSFFY